MGYSTKIIDYGYKRKIICFDKKIETGTTNEASERTSYAAMTEENKMRSDARRIRYYKKQVADLIEIALMNDFKIMATLTFSENIQNYHSALARWQSFLKRLRHYVGSDMQYICVWEYQKRGAIHFHCLFNFYIEHNLLSKIWGNGFAFISSINKQKNDCLKTIQYMTKYMLKTIQERIEQGTDIRGQRFFFTSNNLKKPTISTLEEMLNIEEILFDNMENMLSDGIYQILDEYGHKINAAQYIEFLK